MSGSRMMDIAGHRYGRLLVIRFSEKRTTHKYWECVCECGNIRVVSTNALRSGRVVSCGRANANPAHGMTGTPEHHTWAGIKQRVTGTASSGNHRYSGRGIDCCERWFNSFSAFYADVGPRPSPSHTLDRIDNDRGYHPDNCAWRTITEQNRNKCSNIILEYDGKRMTAAEWARVAGLSNEAIYYRIKAGWTTERVINAPRTKGKLSKEKYNEYRISDGI